LNHRLVGTVVILAAVQVCPAACDHHHLLKILPQDAAAIADSLAAGGTLGVGGATGNGGQDAGGSAGGSAGGATAGGGTVAGAIGLGGTSGLGGDGGLGGRGTGGTQVTGGVGGLLAGGAGGLGGVGTGGVRGLGGAGGSTDAGTGGQVSPDAPVAGVAIDGGLRSGSITVTAVIDGQDLLHILPDGLYWVHVTRAGPGMHNSQTLPTMVISDTVGNVSWCPKWANGCNTCDGSCGELRDRSTSEVFRLDVIPGILVSATFSCAGRGSCTLAQAPTSDAPEAIVDMDDIAPGGPSTYSATLSFIFIPGPHPG
jgi:hypothetical protein